MGPDGHTASLFPHQSSLLYNGPDKIIPIFDSPKPPPNRITMTLLTINSSKNVIYSLIIYLINK